MTRANTMDAPSSEPPVAAVDIKSIQTLPEMLEGACTRYAERPAFSSFNHTLEYRDVALYAHRFSAFLVNEFKLAPLERVALILPNGLPYVVAFYGVLDAGLVVVNINPLATPREIQIQLATAAVSAIIVLENFACKLDEILDENQAKAVISVAVGDLPPLPRRAAMDFVQHVVRDSIPLQRGNTGHLVRPCRVGIRSSEITSAPVSTMSRCCNTREERQALPRDRRRRSDSGFGCRAMAVSNGSADYRRVRADRSVASSLRESDGCKALFRISRSSVAFNRG